MTPHKTVKEHFDSVAKDYDYYKNKNSFYYQNLKKLLGELIPQKSTVLEIGCGTGDLLALLDPKSGYGMDISSKMVAISKIKYQNSKNLSFSTKWPTKKFDYIFMSDVVEHLEKPTETFQKISNLMGGKSIFVCTMMNCVWIPVEAVYNLFGWKMPEGPSKRISFGEIRLLIEESGMKITKHDYKLLIPIKIPLLTNFLNKHFEKPLRRFAFIEYFVAVKV